MHQKRDISAWFGRRGHGRRRFTGAFRHAWHSWDTTGYLLSSPANARRIEEALEDVHAGRGVRFDSVEQLCAAFGFDYDEVMRGRP